MKHKSLIWILFALLATTLSACGGGSGGTTASGNATPTTTNTVASASVSSGTITAFGSVFVNGHEFSTTGATVVDDDAGTTTNTTAGLEVGEVVDVIPAADSTNASPVASELHVHPLVRGYVDASDTATASLTVMGQTVQITAATLFSDHRACVAASTTPCSAITDQSGLTATSGSGASAVAGSYVTVHGYLYNDGSSSGNANIVATLVSVADAPANTSAMVNFKAEGAVTSINNSTITIGGLNVDLSAAKCFAKGLKSDCATAFKTGDVVSTFGATAPSLPATNFTADGARLSSKLPVNVAGLTLEIDGVVSSVSASPAGFVVRGVNIDATGLPAGTTLPAVGDIVEVVGTVSSDGTAVAATSLKILRAVASTYYEFVGDETNVTAGSDANTYTLTMLGQNINVNATTWLADRSSTTWTKQDPTSNPFNISTIQTYLTNSSTRHLVVRAMADASGNLTAMSVTIVPASKVSSVAGLLDATPAPVNSATTGTPSTFAIHGVAISADPAAVVLPAGKQASVAAGDKVVAIGNYSAGTLTVTAQPGSRNVVLVFGKPGTMPMPTPMPVTSGGGPGQM
jgi:hypothetical protein